MAASRYKLTDTDINHLFAGVGTVVEYSTKPPRWKTYTDRDLPEEEQEILKSITLGNIAFSDRYKHPKTTFYAFDVVDIHSNLRVSFSDRSCTNGELRGDLLREYLERERALNPDANVYETLEKVTLGVKDNFLLQRGLHAVRKNITDENQLLALNLTAVIMCEQGLIGSKQYDQKVQTDRNFAKDTFNHLSKSLIALDNLIKKLEADRNKTPACTFLLVQLYSIQNIMNKVASGDIQACNIGMSLDQAEHVIKKTIFKSRHQIAIKNACLKVLNVLIAIFTLGIAHKIQKSKHHRNKFFSDTIDAYNKDLAAYKDSKAITRSWRAKKK